jgi:hypothetical protein
MTGSVPSGPPAAPARRVTLTLAESAEALGVSEDTFRRYVLPDLRVIQASPRIALVRVVELERWAERHEAM